MKTNRSIGSMNIPFNMAESVIELFTDPGLSGLSHWRIESGDAHGLSVYQRWALVQFEWTAKPKEGPALRMSRDFEVDCSLYTTLMVSAVAPEGAILRLKITTEAGELSYESEPFGTLKRECLVPLQGAKEVRSITMEMWPSNEGFALGWFNWIGLQHEGMLERYEAQWSRFDDRWDAYLLPESYEPTFEPMYGLVVNSEELAALRGKHDAWVQEHGTSPFIELAADASKLAPERMIGEFVNFWNDTRYCRDRDYGKHLLTHGPNAAAAGLLMKDRSLLRLAARYAISLAMCEHWDSGFICFLPGSIWEHRSFVQSLCVLETAAILDMAGELFTDYGKELLLRRISEDGQGSIHYSVWKHEYIHHCNQLPWFSPGRLLGYAVMERSMPRVAPYAELAVRDLVATMDDTILPDGGYLEGPMYFAWTARQCAISLYYYARGKGVPFASLVPESLRRSEAFAEALLSTADDTLMILICDAQYINQESLAYLAAILPDSAWVHVFRKSLRMYSGIPETLPSYLLESEIPETGPALRPFIQLPDMGLLSSLREFEGEQVKLFVMGNQAGASHTHEDKGHFVLEFAGDRFAMEPGICDYSLPLAEVLKHAQRHNMLCPVGIEERPRPLNPIPQDVKPRGQGDACSLKVQLDVTPGWEGYYRRWVRTWDSPTPDVWTITDDYELERGTGVEFYWSTPLPTEIVNGEDGEPQEVVLRGRRGLARITVPAGCTVRIDRLPLFGEEYEAFMEQRKEIRCGAMPLESEQTRIVIGKPANAGTLQVQIKLERLPVDEHTL